MANMKNKRSNRVKQVDKKTTPEIGGMNVYFDSRQRPVYYDRFSKRAYLLKDVEKTYQLYSMRFFLGIAAIVIIYAFKLPLWLCVVLGIAVYAFMEFKFRRFLSNLTQMTNFVLEKKISKVDAERQKPLNKVILKIVLFILLATLLVINVKQQGYTGVVLYLNYAFAVASVFMALFELFACLTKNKK